MNFLEQILEVKIRCPDRGVFVWPLHGFSWNVDLELLMGGGSPKENGAWKNISKFPVVQN